MGNVKQHPEFVSIAWITLLTASAVVFVLGNLGISPLAYPLALVFLSCFLLVPVWAFVARRDFAVQLFKELAGNALPGITWDELSPVRRSVVFFCILLCLANAVLLLVLALTRLMS